MVRSFLNLERLDLGFSPDHLVTMRLQLPAAKYANDEARRGFYDRLEPRLAGIARRGVGRGHDSDAAASGLGERTFEIDGRPVAQRDEDRLKRRPSHHQPRFFTVLDRPIRRGREFQDRDGAPGSETVIVNDRFVSKFFPGEDPIGRRIRFVSGTQPEREPTRPGAPSSRSVRRFVTRDTTSRNRSGDLHSVPAGGARRRVTGRSQSAAAVIAGRFAAPRGPGRRRGPAGVHDSDARSDARPGSLAVPRVWRDVRSLRRHRPRALFGRPLCGDGVLGHATNIGNRPAHGARRPGAPGALDGPQARARPARGRAVDRPCWCSAVEHG